MSNAIYPISVRGLAWPILKTHRFNTLISKSAGGAANAVAQMSNPLWTFTLIYNYVKDNPNDLVPALSPYTDYQALRGFMLARRGNFDDFLFDDVSDDYFGPALNPDLSPNTLAELPVISSGGAYYSPVQRIVGGAFSEDITDLQPGGIEVYANGVPATGGGVDYTLSGPGLALPGYSYAGLYLQWNAMPATPVTAEFSFYYRVRFADDSEDLEQFMQTVWTIGGPKSQNGKGTLTLETARAAAI